MSRFQVFLDDGLLLLAIPVPVEKCDACGATCQHSVTTVAIEERLLRYCTPVAQLFGRPSGWVSFFDADLRERFTICPDCSGPVATAEEAAKSVEDAARKEVVAEILKKRKMS